MSTFDIVCVGFVCALVGFFLGCYLAAREHQAKASALYRRIVRVVRPVPLASLTVTEREFPARIRADLQQALEQFFRECEVLHCCGVRVTEDFHGIDLAHLLTKGADAWETPLQHEEINVAK